MSPFDGVDGLDASAPRTAPDPRRAFAWAERSLAGGELSREEALEVLAWPDADLLTLVSAARKVRHAAFGKKVRLNYLLNIQSGICPEDCGYCSQSRVSDAPVEKYKLMTADEVVAAAERAVANKAARLCMVASMRGPSDKDVGEVAKAVREVKERFPQLEMCACLGLLKDGQAARLEDAGVDAYNHNLNTSERHYGEICSTHGFSDRLDTVRKSREAGLSSCSGALFGMGETREDILDVAFRLRELGVDSIPVNFLIPFKGTPLGDKDELTPSFCLKILCLFRLVNPFAEIRIAGGRELHLRSLQPLGLYVANSIFVGDYLTSEGQAPRADIEMIRDMGFEIVGEVPGEAASAPLAERVSISTREMRKAKVME
jgi:biotin synthase